MAAFEILCSKCDAPLTQTIDGGMACLWCKRTATEVGDPDWEGRALQELASGLFDPGPCVLERFTLRAHPGGKLSYVVELMFGRARVVYGNRLGAEEMWDYDTADEAIFAQRQWDPAGPELQGWVRHRPSNRRRPDGDPAREVVR